LSQVFIEHALVVASIQFRAQAESHGLKLVFADAILPWYSGLRLIGLLTKLMHAGKNGLMIENRID